MRERLTEELRGICGASAVLTEPVQLLTYECDALPHLRESPAVVVLPISAAQVQAVVRVCARVMSHTEMATFCPALTRDRSGGLSIGARIAASNVPCGSGSAWRKTGSMTVTGA